MTNSRVADITGTYRPAPCVASAGGIRHAALQLYRAGCPLEYLQYERWHEPSQSWEPYGPGLMAADVVVDATSAGPTRLP